MNHPEISTTRLSLRPFKIEDSDDLHQLWIKPGVRKYLWDDEIVTKEQVASILKESVNAFESNGSGLWGVFIKGHEALIGFCGFWCFHDPPRLQLLYGLDPEQWGQGLAAEAAQAIIRYGFEELSFKRIEASTDAPNMASVRVMENCGMRFLKRENSGGFDTIYYEIYREDFEAMKNFMS